MEREGKCLYLIPGIMGSTLQLQAHTPSGASIDEEVWSEDLNQIRRVLGVRPEWLSENSIYPKSVIRTLKWRPFPPQDMYGGLIQFCTSQSGLGLEEGDNFITFPYDWRKSCQDSAEKLVQFIHSNEEGRSRNIILLGHSMGGLICRLALANDPRLLALTCSLLQVGSPVEGSAQSFYSLKVRPKMHRLFDHSWTIAHNINPTHRANLLRSVATFDSLYELLPPKDLGVLTHRQGSMFPATHRGAWDSKIHAKLDQAEDTHHALRRSVNSLSSILEIIYSDSFPTVGGYLVDDSFQIMRSLATQPRGDQTVSTASALASSAGCPRHQATQNHVGLVSCPELKRVLREVLAR